MKTTLKITVILTAITVVVSAAGFIAVNNASGEYYERHTEIATIAYIVCGIVFLWSAARLILMGARPEKRPILIILSGIGIMAACWFFVYSLPGVIVGGFVAVIGAIFSLKPIVK